MKKWLKKVSDWFDTNIPIIWGILWMLIITFGSLCLVLGLFKFLLEMLGVIG